MGELVSALDGGDVREWVSEWVSKQVVGRVGGWMVSAWVSERMGE